jgi:hypothetical protein
MPSPHRPALSESLYRLSFSGRPYFYLYVKCLQMYSWSGISASSKQLKLLDLRVSHQCLWRYTPCGILHRVEEISILPPGWWLDSHYSPPEQVLYSVRMRWPSYPRLGLHNLGFAATRQFWILADYWQTVSVPDLLGSLNRDWRTIQCNLSNLSNSLVNMFYLTT